VQQAQQSFLNFHIILPLPTASKVRAVLAPQRYDVTVLSHPSLSSRFKIAFVGCLKCSFTGPVRALDHAAMLAPLFYSRTHCSRQNIWLPLQKHTGFDFIGFQRE
jgi:hypothetical protein